MNPFSDYLNRQVRERCWTAEKLAELTGLAPDLVIEHLHGGRFAQRSDRRRYAGALGLSVDALDEAWRYRAPAAQVGIPGFCASTADGNRLGMIPVINRVPAGAPLDYESAGIHDGIGEDYIPRIGSGVDDPQAFAVVVVGDSMEPEFREGDTIVCSPNTPIEPGDVVFVRFGPEREGTCTLKRVYDCDEDVLLKPDNPKHHDLLVPKVQVVNMAKVVARVHDSFGV